MEMALDIIYAYIYNGTIVHFSSFLAVLYNRFFPGRLKSSSLIVLFLSGGEP
jgi:hypothetical protein